LAFRKSALRPVAGNEPPAYDGVSDRAGGFSFHKYRLYFPTVPAHL
jgi:hypothetical protein